MRSTHPPAGHPATPFRARRPGPLLIIALLAGSPLLNGCGYGEVTPRGYDYAKALYSICNRRDEARLEQFASLIEADLSDGEISEREGDWLNDIVAQAREGHWSEANAAVRRLLEDQVEGR